MKRVYGQVVVVAGLLFMLSVAPSWGGGVPPTNDDSDVAFNTGGGTGALSAITTGFNNTAYGFDALTSNTTGNNNTASGNAALLNNSTGGSNTATGAFALFSNTTGGDNTATGFGALFNNTTGGSNIGLGPNALANSTTGNSNIAVGFGSGMNLTGGDNNIYLGSLGPGAAGPESATLRLGSTQTKAFIAGVRGTIVTRPAIPVRIDPNGQLGTRPSSARYKRDIATMGGSSEKVLQLRPVTFTYKEDPDKVRQFGLIAEEVAKVYPELVTHTPKGEVEGVDYEALIPMLLNELQRQQQELAALKAHQARVEAALVQMQTRQAERAAGMTHAAALAER